MSSATSNVQLRLSLTSPALTTALLGRSRRSPVDRRGSATTDLAGHSKEQLGSSYKSSTTLNAYFIAGEEVPRMTGLIHGRIPVGLKLKPGSPTHINVSRLALEQMKRIDSDSLPTARDSNKIDTFERLSLQLEAIVERSNFCDSITDEIIDIFGPDFEMVDNVHANTRAHSRTAKATTSNRSKTATFRVFDLESKGSQLISGFLDLELEEAPWLSEDSAPLRLAEHKIATEADLIEIRAKVTNVLSDSVKLSQTLNEKLTQFPALPISALLAEAVAHDEPKLKMLEQSLAQLQSTPLSSNQTSVQRAIEIIKNIGIGEVVLVSPEGPHAIAGGLAQVIGGLMNGLAHSGVPATLISVLYSEAQGARHRSAATFIESGIPFNGLRLALKKIGQVPVHIGPLIDRSSGWTRHEAITLGVEVYEARYEHARILLLHEPSLAPRMYHATHSDSQLKSALLLSRGALEIIRAQAFKLQPSVIISHDWLSALVPVLAKTDPLYRSCSRISEARGIHMLHNCGRAYQGIINLEQNGLDLWPMLALSAEHVGGLEDPHLPGTLNLTAGAALHVRDALLTVSREYARDLLTPQGSEGLSSAFAARKDNLFGISNGIDLKAVQKTFLGLAAQTQENYDQSTPTLAKTSQVLQSQLLNLKRTTRLSVQQQYGLHVDENSLLISMVGRLAEQKGIKLLSEWHYNMSALEAVLRRHRHVQFLIAGPLVEGEEAGQNLRALVQYLEGQYPGRIKGIFDFIPHREALRVTLASDLFLMPSRYEPGGITQLEALAAGTLVVARKVGGLAATITNFDPAQGIGNGFVFDDFSGWELRETMDLAIEALKDSTQRQLLMQQAFEARNDWSDRLPQYLALFQETLGVLAHFDSSILDQRKDLVERARASAPANQRFT